MHIIEHASMKEKTTMRLGGFAYQEIHIQSYHDADKLLLHLEKENLPSFILGGGSNLLIDSEPLEACIIRSLYQIPLRITKETEDYMYIESPLSIPLQRFVRYAIKHGAQGFEGLAGIPGSLGGAIAMNAGSFGSAIGNFLYELDILSLREGIISCSRADFQYEYRSFTIPTIASPFLGLRALFQCPKQPTESLSQIFTHNLQLKKQRQPLNKFSAGCVFKNPSQQSAWKLLQDAGMKEHRTEHFYFSPLHANFLLHDGNGSLDEALYLLSQAKKNVHEYFGIELELEVKIWTTRPICTI